MRRLIGALALLSTIALQTASAATTGTIEGKILNGETDRPVAGVAVTLVGRNRDGSEPLERTMFTKRDGAYRFDGLPTGDDRIYTIDARHDGGTFAGGAMTLPDDTDRRPVFETTLRVWDTTTDPTSILIERDDMFVVPGDGDVGVIESVTIANTSRFAYIGRGGASGSDAETIGFALPAGAQAQGVLIRDSTIDIPEIKGTEYGFAATVAIPPGETRVTFLYGISGSGGSFELSKRALYPMLETSVFAAPPFEIESNRLELDPDGEVTLEGRTYARYRTSEAVDAGDSIQAVAVAGANLSPWIPVAGIAAGLLAIAAIGLFARRRVTPVTARDEREVPDDLVAAIAELDLRYRSGELSQTQWANDRAALKARLGDRVGAR